MKKTEKLKFVPHHLYKNAVTSSQQTLNLATTTQDCCWSNADMISTLNRCHIVNFDSMLKLTLKQRWIWVDTKQFCCQLTMLVKLRHPYINVKKTTSLQRSNYVDKYTLAQLSLSSKYQDDVFAGLQFVIMHCWQFLQFIII